MDLNNPRRPRDNVVRQPRVSELMPTVAEPVPIRHPRRIFSSPFMLAFGFFMLILAGINSTDRGWVLISGHLVSAAPLGYISTETAK